MRMIIINYNTPLNDLDSESQTYGCRRKNPEICKNHMLTDVCSFVREDRICKNPSRAWAKQYRKLTTKRKG